LELKFTPDYNANESVFWHIFKELAKDNNGLVAYDKCNFPDYFIYSYHIPITSFNIIYFLNY